MSTSSEEIQIRCRRCGQKIADGYFKPVSDWARRKVTWWAGRLLCERCTGETP